MDQTETRSERGHGVKTVEAGKIEEIKTLVELCKQNPSVLHTPSLAFFKDFLESLGAQILESGKSGKDGDDIVESDVELDNSDVVEPDNDPPQKMGDLAVEVTEQNQEVAQILKVAAMDAIAHGMPDEAIEHLTKAIMSNPKSAILYANRADVFVKIKKPNAAIRDADAALQINPDSAKGYKARGMARAMLGLWGEAVSDLRVASKLDFDEEIGLVLKKVELNVRKIEEHRRKYDCFRKEKELMKMELEKQRRQVKSEESEAESEYVSVSKDGQVIGIHSTYELRGKLNAARKTSRLSVLYFTATWCGPCRYISPEFSDMAEKYPKVAFLKLDIDDVQSVAAEYNVSSIPSFFFIKNGREVDNLVGVDINALEMKIAQHSA